MRDNRNGGIALIIGAISGIITMILHPVSGGGGHVITPAQFEKLAALMTGVHVLAIAGIPFLFLGALALSRHLGIGGRLAFAALVIYSLGLVAVMIAPAMSGLVGTQILRKTVAHGADVAQWRLLMEYNFLINQAFAKIFVVASCTAIALWSFLMVKGRALSTGLGVYGLLLAPVIVVAMTGGALSLDAHGFGLIVFCEAIWLIAAGSLLIRTGPAHSRVTSGTEPVTARV